MIVDLHKFDKLQTTSTIRAHSLQPRALTWRSLDDPLVSSASPDETCLQQAKPLQIAKKKVLIKQLD